MRPPRLHRLRRLWPLAVVVLLLVDGMTLIAQPDTTKPPFAPWSVHLPELGRMRGTMTQCLRRGSGEEFARDFAGVGDVNGDGLDDWVVSRRRCDTVVHVMEGTTVWERIPVETHLYFGSRSGLPTADAGVRIGPTEGDALTSFLAAGDFDGDGHRDIVLRFQRLLDTADGNAGLVWERHSLAVYWGDGSGTFSNSDSTQLPCEGSYWMALVQAIARDFDHDGADDLLVHGLGGFSNGAPTTIPTLRIYRGAVGVRWGRSPQHPRAPAWTKWNAWSVTHGRLSVLDQNCDGRLDLVFYYDNNAGPSRITVCYGGASGFPDTLDFESLEPTVANGRAALFSDITGDGAPELLLNCGNHQAVKIFAGRPGQRLLEQYGSGLDAPVEGRGWWHRPWAEIWTPSRLRSSFLASGYDGFLELGDISTDGIDEVWIVSWPYIFGYRSLERLDSLADAWMRFNDELTHAARLGDIDGSGRVTVAISHDIYPHDLNTPFPGEMIFYRSTPEVTGLSWVNPRRAMPHLAGERCGETASAAIDRPAAVTIAPSLALRPNPSGDVVEIVVSGAAAGEATYAVHDMAGALLLRGRLDDDGRASVAVGSLPSGTYLVRVVAGEHALSETIQRR